MPHSKLAGNFFCMIHPQLYDTGNVKNKLICTLWNAWGLHKTFYTATKRISAIWEFVHAALQYLNHPARHLWNHRSFLDVIGASAFASTDCAWRQFAQYAIQLYLGYDKCVESIFSMNLEITILETSSCSRNYTIQTTWGVGGTIHGHSSSWIWFNKIMD